ncbi:MAG TPA: alpha/beta fold hydrolase [Thermoanaerobaculia bacterium]
MRSILLLCLLILVPVTVQAADSPAAGHWEGEIELPTMKLQVMVDLTQENGAWKGDIDIPMQGAKDLPLEGVTVEGTKVRFAIANVPGAPTFDGTLENGAIRGTFTQSGASLPFRLGREAVEVPRKPQEPKPPLPYISEEVTYTNGDIKLAGTLTIPEGPGPFPAALLITGSGAQDRDEALLGHKPFLVLSDYLTRNGIAVLRVDDRGVGGSTGSVDESTSADFAQDALAGVRFLKQHAKIAPDRIGLIGHSEGGVVGPLAASQSTDVAFVVMLAGTGVPGGEVITLQSQRISRASGMPEENIKREDAIMRQSLELIRTEKDPAVRDPKLKQLAKEAQALQGPEGQAGGDEAADAMVKAMTSNWFRFFLDYDPRTALRKVKVPVLVLNGDLDLQVIADQNIPEIEKALKEAGNPDVTIRRLAGLNHLFQPAKTGGPAEYVTSEITMDPAVLDLVAKWIRERFAAPKKTATR